MRISEGVQTCALPISRVPVLLALPSISVACSRRPLASTRAWSTVATSRGPSTAGLNRECRSDCGWLQTLDCCAAVLPWGESSWTVMDGLAAEYVTVCVRTGIEPSKLGRTRGTLMLQCRTRRRQLSHTTPHPPPAPAPEPPPPPPPHPTPPPPRPPRQPAQRPRRPCAGTAPPWASTTSPPAATSPKKSTSSSRSPRTPSR